MAALTTLDPAPRSGLDHAAADLEAGRIVLLGRGDALLPDTDLAFLRTLSCVSARHKNIAYDPRTQLVSGLGVNDPRTGDALRRVLHTYSARVTARVAGLCPRYSAAWTVDLASFRPLEEADRRLTGRARNDRFHIDAFPARLTHGDRILRVFTNIHPTRPRSWLSGNPLDQLLPALRQLRAFPLPRPRRFGSGTLRAAAAHRLGIPALSRSAYDRFMLRLHDFMKQSDDFQRQCHPTRHAFAPLASWMAFTDTVPHAVLAGQYALEQTYFVPHEALALPERAPLALFEHLARARLVAPQ